MFFHFLTNMFKNILHVSFSILWHTTIYHPEVDTSEFFLNQCVLKYGILQDGLIYLFNIYFAQTQIFFCLFQITGPESFLW